MQDAPVAGHGGKLGGGHKLPAQPLGVLVVAFRLPTGAALGLHGDGGLAQPVLGNLLDGAGLPAPEEYHAVHVAEYRLGVLVVDCLTLGQLLVEQRQAHLPGADDRHQLFEVGHLPGVGGLVPQHPHMMGQAAPVYVVRSFAQEVAEDIIRDAEAELDEKEKHRKHKMMINRTLSIGILKNDLIYILLETDARKQDELFQQIYEDISKNLVPIRPERHYRRTKGQLAGKYSNTHKRAY